MKPYSRVRIRLTKSQIDKIRNSIKKNTGTVIRISNKSIDFRNGLEIYLTQTQIKKLKSSSKPINITLSNEQVRKMSHYGKGKWGEAVKELLPILAGEAASLALTASALPVEMRPRFLRKYNNQINKGVNLLLKP